jgi:hypothetical protein
MSDITVTPASEVAGTNLPFTIGIGLFGNSELLPTFLGRYAIPVVHDTVKADSLLHAVHEIARELHSVAFA